MRRQVQGHSLSAVTAANYERDLTEFCADAGPDRVLDDLTSDDLDDLILAYGAKPDSRYKPRPGVEAKTRGVGAQARYRQSVNRFFAEAAASGWVQANPMLRSKVRPRTKGVSAASRKALPQSAAVALLQLDPAVRANGKPVRTDMRLGLRDEFLLRLLMEAGPRVSEVCRANRADLERRDDGTVWLRLLGKGNKHRDVPLSPGTVEVYERYLAEERPAPKARTRRITDDQTGEEQTVEVVPAEDAERALVLTWRGLRMTPRDLQLLVERSAARLPAQVRRTVTPHGLRHTAATLLLSSGAADIKTVQALLGHESIATTGIYLDTISAELVNAVRLHPVTGDHTPSPSV